MLTHHYGPQVHILDDSFLNGLLAELCHPRTFQPQINRLVQVLYSHLISTCLKQEFPIENFSEITRMTESHPEQFNKGHRISREQKAVCVNLARAGTYPSHICYEFLHYAIEPNNLRQDHIFAARTTNKNDEVTGTDFGALKIGGGVKDSMVIIPDPMGATGNTIVSSIDFYKKNTEGPARKYIALHLIVTPEYLKRVLAHHPDIAIYALRLDRGLSTEAALNAVPGQFWEQEKGLNSKDYIVPGGGGFGEIMNNSFV